MFYQFLLWQLFLMALFCAALRRFTSSKFFFLLSPGLFVCFIIIIIIIIYYSCMLVFHWRLSLSILAVFNNAVIWMVSTRPPTCKSSRPFNNPLVTVPKAPVTIGIIVTFMFHSFFNSLARLRYLSLFSHSFSFIQWSAGTAKSTILYTKCTQKVSRLNLYLPKHKWKIYSMSIQQPYSKEFFISGSTSLNSLLWTGTVIFQVLGVTF